MDFEAYEQDEKTQGGGRTQNTNPHRSRYKVGASGGPGSVFRDRLSAPTEAQATSCAIPYHRSLGRNHLEHGQGRFCRSTDGSWKQKAQAVRLLNRTSFGASKSTRPLRIALNLLNGERKKNLMSLQKSIHLITRPNPNAKRRACATEILPERSHLPSANASIAASDKLPVLVLSM